ncbi:MAG TPA: TetR/AcrR family transcriptional regulator [Acidimicrobiia bacterium]|jgi:AcrR family transcriptional regulator
MAPTADHGQQTRDRLVEATVAVIVERGWGGVTTRVVAQRAGVRPGLVHYHFDSVDDLRRAAVLATFDTEIEPFLERIEAMSPRLMVEEVVAASLGRYAPDTDIGILLYECMPAASRDAELRVGLRAVLGRFREAIAGRIRACHPEPLGEPDLLAEVIAAQIDGLQLHLLVERELDLMAHLEPLLQLLGPEQTTGDAT